MATSAPPKDRAIREPAAKYFGRAQASAKPLSARMNYLAVFRADPIDRIGMIKRGIPAATVEVMARRMAMPKERLLASLGLARATVERKVRENRPLSNDEGARVIGMARLVGQVQAMVEESGDPKGFDAAAWVARWLELPLPALGGRRPGELMDTAEGQGLVADLVARMQSGSYA